MEEGRQKWGVLGNLIENRFLPPWGGPKSFQLDLREKLKKCLQIGQKIGDFSSPNILSPFKLRKLLECCIIPRQETKKKRGDFSFFKLRRHDTNVWGRNLPIFWPI